MTYEQHLVAARVRLGHVAIVSSPVGEPCTVRDPSGRIIRGYRPPEGYQLSENEVLFRGQPVRARWVDARSGEPTEDEVTGRQLLGPKPGGGVELVRCDEYRLEVEPIGRGEP